MPDISAELDALLRAGIVEQAGHRYQLTAAGRAYADARGLGRGPSQPEGTPAATSGSSCLVQGECVDGDGASVPESKETPR